MMEKPRVLIITGNELRHRFMANYISHHLPVAGVVFEKKANVHERFDWPEEEKQVMEAHFKARQVSEKYFFEEASNVDNLDAVWVETGKSNSEDIINWIANHSFDYILLFGSSLIKAPLLSQYENRFLNLHLGLSPYYRGSGTNFWPLVHGKPECVGATLHLATLQVDAGAILHQVRPDAGILDGPHDLGHKTIIKAVEAFPEVVKRYHSRILQPKAQDLTQGEECKRKDLNALDIQKMYEQFESGMMAEYINQQSVRQAQYPIVTAF
jgi:methionyl-tRNA formyltransferase